jgi:IS605 OrfB family transposase
MKTYNIQLEFQNEEDKKLLLDTFEVHKNIWNYISKYVFAHKLKAWGKDVHDATYHKCRTKFPHSPSQIVIRAREDVVATYKTIKSNKHKIEEEPWKNNLSIRLDKRLYTLEKDSIKLTTVGRRIICKLKLYKKLEELFKFNTKDPLIFVRKNKVFLALTFDTPEPIFNPNQCVGIDLGLNRIAVTSEGKMISGSDYIKTKRKIRYLKRCLQRKKRTRTKRSDSARKHLRKLKRKELNYSKNYIHHLANELLKTNCNTLVLEDLGSLKDHSKGRLQNNKLSQIPFFQLLTTLKYKAQALGKRVETVNPAYTSKEDFRGIERGMRKGCRYYASDKKVLDADLNAAINIGQRWGNKNKLPVSFVFPSDGKYKPNGQGVCQPPNRLVPETRQAHEFIRG